MRKIFFLAVIITILMCAALAGAASDMQNSATATIQIKSQTADAVITVLSTTDVHGFVTPYDYTTGKSIDNSLASAYTIVRGEQQKYPINMLVDAGDTLQGTPLASSYDSIDTTWATHPLFKIYDLMNYDAVCIGNHDFNFGENLLIKARQELKTPLLGANIIDTKTNSTWQEVAPYVIKDYRTPKGSIKVAIIGVVTPAIPCWENPGNYAGLSFGDQVPAARAAIDALKGKVDAFVLISHSGVEIPGAETIDNENEVARIAFACPELSLIIGGHKHQVWDESRTITDLNKKPLYTNSVIAGVQYMSPGMFGKYVGEAQLGFNKTATGWKAAFVNTKNIPVAGAAPDKMVVNYFQPYQDKVIKYHDSTIGIADSAFTATTYTADNPLVRLINQTMMYYGKADLAASANFNKDAVIPAGKVIRRSMYSLYVYENYLYTIRISGKQLRQFLEYSARFINLATVGATEFTYGGPANSIPSYNYDIVEGAKYTINAANPPGYRITLLECNGKAVLDSDSFSFAINNYRFNGGGGFMAAMGFDEKHPPEVLYDSQKALGDNGQIRNLITDYIIMQKHIKPIYESNPSIVAK